MKYSLLDIITSSRQTSLIPRMAVCHPCSELTLQAAITAGRLGIVEPILIGPKARLKELAAKLETDISDFVINDTRNIAESAARAVLSEKSARIKGIDSQVAGRADILVAPDLEAGNIVAKQLILLTGADAAGVVLGASVPIVLPSRAESARSRLASCAIAGLYPVSTKYEYKEYY